MATGTKKLTYQNFYGGISEDDALGTAGSVLFSENLNMNSTSRFVQLTPKPTLKVDTGTRDMTCMYEHGGTVVYAGEGGAIFINDEPDVVIAPLGSDIVNIFKFRGDLILVTNEGTSVAAKYHTIDLDDISNTNWTGLLTIDSSAYGTLPKGSDTIPVKEIGDFIIMGLQDVVVRMTATGIEEFNFTNSDIVGVTYLGGNIRIYQDDGVLFLWNGGNNYERIDLDIVVRAVYSIGNLDYIVGGYNAFYSTLYELQGYTPIPRFVNTYSYKLEESKFLVDNRGPNALTFKDGVMFLTTEANGVATYGARLQGMPKGYIIEHTKSSFGENYSYINGVYGRQNGIYISFKDDGDNRGIDFIDLNKPLTDFQSNGYFITNLEDFGNIQQEKRLNRIEVRVADVTSTKKVKVYTSFDNDTDFTLIGTADSQPTDGIYKVQAKGNFKEMCVKVEIDTSEFVGTLTDSPKIYGLTIYYE